MKNEDSKNLSHNASVLTENDLKKSFTQGNVTQRNKRKSLELGSTTNRGTHQMKQSNTQTNLQLNSYQKNYKHQFLVSNKNQTVKSKKPSLRT